MAVLLNEPSGTARRPEEQFPYRPLCAGERGDFFLLFRARACFLGLRPTGLDLVSKKLLANLVCLQLADVFHENSLVLERVTLHFQVIRVAVCLPGCTASSKQSGKNSPPPRPGHLLRH